LTNLFKKSKTLRIFEQQQRKLWCFHFNTEQFIGNTKTDLIKRKTFELYRRNSRNIEIITYDELLTRAKFIVNDNNESENDVTIDIDDPPF